MRHQARSPSPVTYGQYGPNPLSGPSVSSNHIQDNYWCLWGRRGSRKCLRQRQRPSSRLSPCLQPSRALLTPADANRAGNRMWSSQPPTPSDAPCVAAHLTSCCQPPNHRDKIRNVCPDKSRPVTGPRLRVDGAPDHQTQKQDQGVAQEVSS